jgi:hypothetical protein
MQNHRGKPLRRIARTLRAPGLLLFPSRAASTEGLGVGFFFLGALTSGVCSVRDDGAAGDGFGLFRRSFSNGVSIRMSRSNVCIGMLGDFCIKGFC